jgi:hypothetical protein
MTAIDELIEAVGGLSFNETCDCPRCFGIRRVRALLPAARAASERLKTGGVVKVPVRLCPVLKDGATNEEWDSWDESVQEWSGEVVKDLLPCEKCGSHDLDFNNDSHYLMCVPCGWIYNCDKSDEEDAVYKMLCRWNTRYIPGADPKREEMARTMEATFWAAMEFVDYYKRIEMSMLTRDEAIKAECKFEILREHLYKTVESSGESLEPNWMAGRFDLDDLDKRVRELRAELEGKG